MAEVTPASNVLIMANTDTYTPNGRKIKVKGVRLVAGATVATATIAASSGKIVYSLAANLNESDECAIANNIDGLSLTAALAGTGATLYVYLE